MTKFKDTFFSITCITAENVRSPWVYYEVGLIASKQDAGIVCPYLVGVPIKLIGDTPLAEFQRTEADKSDTWKLILSINKESQRQGRTMKRSWRAIFKSQWPKKSKIDKIISEMGEVEEKVTEVLQSQGAGTSANGEEVPNSRL